MAIEPCDDRNRLMVLMEKGRLPEDGLILALGDLFRRLVLPGEVRHDLLGEILDGVQCLVRVAAEIHIEDDPTDAKLVIDGQLVDHLLLHADQQASRHLVHRLASWQ